MTTKRFGYLDDFTLKNSKVGIGTSTPTEALEVIGGSRTKDIAVTGIATLTSYEGFQNKKTSYVDNVNITGGESGTLSGEVVIGAGLTMSVGTGATTGQGSIKSLKVSNTFTPPIGGTNDRPSAPLPGAIFYNKDFRTIEYWDGSFWRQVDNTTRSGRALGFGGMTAPAATAFKTIDTVNISTQGNAIDFGEMIATARNNGSLSSAIRAFSAGGFNPSTQNDIDYIAIASGGTCADFGELSTDRAPYNGAASSSTRGIFAGGYGPGGTKNVIDYIEMMTLGNAVDFGDMVNARFNHGGCSSPTRAVYLGGSVDSGTFIDYVTISSKGNTTKFGNLTGDRGSGMTCSNSVRGLATGHYQDISDTTVDYFTIASEGNAQVFGDLNVNQAMGAATASATRGLFAGGYSGPSGNQNIIQFMNIQTQGNGADFGDLSFGRSKFDITSDSHGGLGGF
jgi:hypothetical protein